MELLRVASVLGSSLAVTDLALVTGRPTAGLLAALEEAMAAGILEPRDEQLGFRHDLIREALYHDLSAPVRQGLHLDAGRALAAAGAPPERVAEQLVRGATGPSEPAGSRRSCERPIGPTSRGTWAAVRGPAPDSVWPAFRSEQQTVTSLRRAVVAPPLVL